jgi:serine phosphatase RsbU (regulator of sigma subunit)
LDLQIIRQNPLFENLPEIEMKDLKDQSQEELFKTGEILFKEGSVSDDFYLLIEGQVEIIKSLGSADERKLGILHPGAILGEMSKFNQDGKHTASVRVNKPSKFLKVPFSWLDSLLARNPQIYYDLMRHYTSRLENSENLTIKDLREKNTKLKQAYDDLKLAQAAMIEKEKLEQEMRLASNIQRNILPKKFPRSPGLDFGALMIPAKQVGGDFYDFILLDDQRIGIVIGDVCDKGMPAALLMALTYSSVRMEALRTSDPGDTLRHVNQHLIQIGCCDMFVTLLYGILDCNKLTFSFARAGHPKPLLLNAKNQSMPVPYGYGQAVGIFEEFFVDEASVKLPKGGTLLLYSDGLSETIDEFKSSPGLSKFCSSTLGNEELSAQACCEKLWKTVGGSATESMIKDDFTVVVVKSSK